MVWGLFASLFLFACLGKLSEKNASILATTSEKARRRALHPYLHTPPPGSSTHPHRQVVLDIVNKPARRVGLFSAPRCLYQNANHITNHGAGNSSSGRSDLGGVLGQQHPHQHQRLCGHAVFRAFITAVVVVVDAASSVWEVSLPLAIRQQTGGSPAGRRGQRRQ